MEAWLLLRSLRTFPLRIRKQSENACALAAWLEQQLDAQQHLPQDRRTLSRVWHTSLKSHPDHSICSAQSEGHTPLLSVELWSAAQAVRFPALLKMFQPATSLGGAESLIDYRYRWDQTVSDKLLRVSVGIENVRDLQDDFAQAFAALLSAASL
eukprot:TRINITY_DN8159_c0_g1_i16.p2 TRINITY_DN8159_c0_g1~~TRINITY_DN8159_c0_g1_i16.p2  ORF type:complete len:154 (+),score=33.77 TRINITY_DN8159_c0_g1_i16:752-1213(+)